MNEQNLTHQIMHLHSQGMSIRKIAKQLGISKSAVHRTVSDNGTLSRDTPVPLSQQACPTGVPILKQTILPVNNNNFNYKNSKTMEHYDYESMKEIEIRRLELEHEIQMKKLEMQEEELSLRSRELHLKSKQVNSESIKQEQEFRVLNWELTEIFSEELELVDSKGNIEISLEDGEEKIEALKELRKKIQKFCAVYKVSIETFQLFKYLQKLIMLVSKELDTVYEDDRYDEDDEDTTWSLDYRLDFNERQTIKRLLQEEND